MHTGHTNIRGMVFCGFLAGSRTKSGKNEKTTVMKEYVAAISS
jgi:hypothetical protein